jgi:hypothetical protein
MPSRLRACESGAKRVGLHIGIPSPRRVGGQGSPQGGLLVRPPAGWKDHAPARSLQGAFQPPPLRDNLGKLWENYLVIERRKRLSYAGEPFNAWFWRTYDRQEIDYIEERGSRLAAFEFKWNPARKTRLPKVFLQSYPHAQTAVVTPENVRDFVG